MSEPPALFGVFHLVAHQIIKTPPLKSLFCNDLRKNRGARVVVTPYVVVTYNYLGNLSISFRISVDRLKTSLYNGRYK